MKLWIQALVGLVLVIAIPLQITADPPGDDKPQRDPFRPPPLPGQPQRDPNHPFDLPPPPGGPGPRFQPGGPVPREEAPEDVIRALTAALKDDDLEVRKLAAATLVYLHQGKKATDALVSLLNSTDTDTRKFAVEHLAAASTDSVDALAEALKSKDRDTRANAAYALARIGRPAADASASLLKLVKDDDIEVRRRVLYAFNRIYAAPLNLFQPGPGGSIVPIVPGSGSGAQSDGGPQVPDPGVLAPAKKSEK